MAKAKKTNTEQDLLGDEEGAGIGHNVSTAGKQILSIIERFERMTEEIKELQTDRKEILAEAKGNGFDVATIKRIVKLRAMAQANRAEQEALLDTYLTAIGMV